MAIKHIGVATLSFVIATALLFGLARYGRDSAIALLTLDRRVLGVVTLIGLTVMLTCVLVLRRRRRNVNHGDK